MSKIANMRFFIWKPKTFPKPTDDKNTTTESSTENNRTNIETETSHVNNTSLIFYLITGITLCLTIFVLDLNLAILILIYHHTRYDGAKLATTLMVIGLTIQIVACCTAFCVSRCTDNEKKLEIVSRVQECACVIFVFAFAGSLFTEDKGVATINMFYILITSLCLVIVALYPKVTASQNPTL